MNQIKVTIFTPTYNRGYRIENLYQSLQRQTNKNFEWIVIDDGSTDNTQELFNQWVAESNDFDICYIKVANGGKHRAINKGSQVAKGELFFIVDSDDVLTEDAIDRVVYWESTLDNKKHYCGVTGNRGYNEHQMIGGTFQGEYLDGTFLVKNKHNIYGDKSEVFYTHLLQKYQFPEIEGENFMTEDVVWLFLAYDGYQTRWFNEIIYITEYLPDGLSYNINSVIDNNPKGWGLTNKLFQILYS